MNFIHIYETVYNFYRLQEASIKNVANTLKVPIKSSLNIKGFDSKAFEKLEYNISTSIASAAGINGKRNEEIFEDAVNYIISHPTDYGFPSINSAKYWFGELLSS